MGVASNFTQAYREEHIIPDSNGFETVKESVKGGRAGLSLITQLLKENLNKL